MARQGIAVREPHDIDGLDFSSGDSKLKHTPEGYGGFDILPLFDTIIGHCEAYRDRREEPLQMQISSLAYDDYIGRLGIGRVTRGTVYEGQSVSVCREGGEIVRRKINQVFVYRGLKRTAVPEAECGDIVIISGISDISIGETVCDADVPEAMEMIRIEEPTLSMNFMVNSSPFAGRVGKFVTSRHIRERLRRELEVKSGSVFIDEIAEFIPVKVHLQNSVIVFMFTANNSNITKFHSLVSDKFQYLLTYIQCLSPKIRT